MKRCFRAERPNQLWVADFSYVPTWSGFAYTAFITDVYARTIVGSRAAASTTADLVTDALEMAIFSRRGRLLRGVIRPHRTDAACPGPAGSDSQAGTGVKVSGRYRGLASVELTDVVYG